MQYKIEEIEDQIVATLQASSDMNGATVRTHSGEVNVLMFTDPQYMEGAIATLPFVLVHYAGRVSKSRDSVGGTCLHELTFTLYVGAQSLRSRQESARSAYAMLRTVYDCLHGHVINGSTLASTMPRLLGDATTVYSSTALIAVDGADERLIVELPKIAVYSTSYKITVQA